MKVLIATDGSEYSRAAIDECCRMFEKSAAGEIRIISVFEPLIPTAGPYIVSAEYVQMIDDETRLRAKSNVEKGFIQISENFPALASQTSAKVVGGMPAQRIVEEAESWGANLIVCGSHGFGFWKRAWMGSVSSALVHHAPCSVMVVRAKAEAQSATV
jgi:nucleotide-binding universal stress UspA family protein